MIKANFLKIQESIFTIYESKIINESEYKMLISILEFKQKLYESETDKHMFNNILSEIKHNNDKISNNFGKELNNLNRIFTEKIKSCENHFFKNFIYRQEKWK